MTRQLALQAAQSLTERGVSYSPECHKGLLWEEGLHVRHDRPHGPGWYIFARRPEYGGRYVRRVARPTGAPRPHRHYSRLVSPGWKRKKDAEQVLRILVALLAPTIGPTVLSTMCGGLNVHA